MAGARRRSVTVDEVRFQNRVGFSVASAGCSPANATDQHQCSRELDNEQGDTLGSKEVKGVLGKKEFKAADPDNDGTLTKDEYLAIVEKLFKKADVDNDGTLDAKELRSKAGARSAAPDRPV